MDIKFYTVNDVIFVGNCNCPSAQRKKTNQRQNLNLNDKI